MIGDQLNYIIDYMFKLFLYTPQRKTLSPFDFPSLSHMAHLFSTKAPLHQPILFSIQTHQTPWLASPSPSSSSFLSSPSLSLVTCPNLRTSSPDLMQKPNPLSSPNYRSQNQGPNPKSLKRRRSVKSPNDPALYRRRILKSLRRPSTSWSRSTNSKMFAILTTYRISGSHSASPCATTTTIATTALGVLDTDLATDSGAGLFPGLRVGIIKWMFTRF
jgi:hypothetical protein